MNLSYRPIHQVLIDVHLLINFIALTGVEARTLQVTLRPAALLIARIRFQLFCLSLHCQRSKSN